MNKVLTVIIGLILGTVGAYFAIRYVAERDARLNSMCYDHAAQEAYQPNNGVCERQSLFIN